MDIFHDLCDFRTPVARRRRAGPRAYVRATRNSTVMYTVSESGYGGGVPIKMIILLLLVETVSAC